jgi:hypothetical protein
MRSLALQESEKKPHDEDECRILIWSHLDLLLS